MKCIIAVSLLLLLGPAPLRAQREEAVPKRTAGTAVTTPAPSFPVVIAPAEQDTVRRRRRRGSMVGYVEDATVGTKLRVRFESAFNNFVPDRAEFFYAKCGCYRDLPHGNPARDPEAGGPGPGIATGIDFQQIFLAGEYLLRERVSVFAELPHRWIQPQFDPGGASFPSAAGLGDLRMGSRFALIDDSLRALTAQVQLYLSTGDAARGLGTDHNTIEPALLYYHRFTDRVAVEGQLGLWHPFGRAAGVPTDGGDTFAGDVLNYGIGSSYVAYETPRLLLAPVVELVGWRVLSGFQTAATPDASGTNIINLKVGGRAVFGQNSLYLGYGTGLTSESWYENIVRIEYRHLF